MIKTFQTILFSELVMKGSSDNDFDFVLTASRTESQRKLRVPGEVAAVGRMGFEVERMREEIRAKSTTELKEILGRQDKILNNSALINKGGVVLVRLGKSPEEARLFFAFLDVLDYLETTNNNNC